MSGCEAHLVDEPPPAPPPHEPRRCAMTSREWQPGDVAVATFCGEEGVRVSRYGHGWARLTDPDDFINDDDALGEFRVTDARPLVVIDPEQTDLYIQSDGRDMTLWADDEALQTEQQTDKALWAHLKATLPTRDEPQPEPLGLGAVVEDDDGRQWVRTDQQEWTSAGDYTDDFRSIDVRRVLSEGYVLWEPDAPSADERPFKVGDRVRVSKDHGLRRIAGEVGRIDRIDNESPRHPTAYILFNHGWDWAGLNALTHADEVTP